MDESAKANFDSCFVEETLLEGEMLTMGLPTSFGTKKQTTESEPKKDSGARKRRFVFLIVVFSVRIEFFAGMKGMEKKMSHL